MNNNLYQKINNLTGFALFAISGLVFWLTMEPTLSFWDCGEFIAASYKLQVGHQPGAPLFLMIGKLFSLLAGGNTAKVAYFMNLSSALFSAATVMFLYWSITLLAARLFPKEKSPVDALSIIGAGVIGALAFTFSDTFWFSAVEAEVYSLSILSTAIVFWAILKWEQNGNDHWLVLISFIVGLSIGVHLLSLLAIPAVVLVYYFRKNPQASWPGILKAIAFSGLIWVVVQIGIIQYSVMAAARLDIFFVNTLGLGFGSGALFFLFLLAALLTLGIRYSIRRQKYQLNLGLICFTFVFFGFCSYFMIIIRANAGTELNLSTPDNAYSLNNYLGRTNYGQVPLLYGQTFDAQDIDGRETSTLYRRGKDKYEAAGKDFELKYDKNMLFPRTYSNKPHHIEFYKQWMHLADGETPSFLKNLEFFFSYQSGFMYWRYFMWNFAGRQNDVQGQGSRDAGNWITGIKPLDGLRLDRQDKLPPSITENEGYNRFFGLPLILGIAGLLFLYRRNRHQMIVVSTLFFFTGMAIIVYLNQDPLQVRERDYAYVGSFYAFAIFIGFGLLALKDLLSRFAAERLSLAAAGLICMLAAPALMGWQGWDDHNRSGKTTALEWASNYLNSCAPNAILFTNADNDTFPLWYAQQVEGIRTDVRVVNMQYLSDDGYINQMKLQAGKSAPLPISLPESKYVKGVRDYVRYFDYGIMDSVELKELLAVMTSDDKEDKMPLSDGNYYNFMPSRNLKLTVDAGEVIRTGTLAAKDRSRITPEMKWTFRENIARKADIILFDILVNNHWKRPVYFGSSVSDDTYAGLERYLYLEGYAHRLLPLERDTADKRDKERVTNSEVMYSNITQKFKLKGFKTAKYLDPESRRIARTTWQFNNTLAANLIDEGEPEKAATILIKNVRELPLKNYSIEDTLSKMPTIEGLYQTGHDEMASALLKANLDYVTKEISYIASLPTRRYDDYGYYLRQGFVVLHNMKRITETYRQPELGKVVNERIESLQSNFM